MTTSADATLRPLDDAELDAVGGGLNPQPLPPRWLSSFLTQQRLWSMLNPQPLPPIFRFSFRV